MSYSRGRNEVREVHPPAGPRTLQEYELSETQWKVLTDAIFPTARTGEAICLALDYCRSRKLDIFRRPVHIVPMYSAVKRTMIETVWPSVQLYQTDAARTGQWAGMDTPKWGPLVKRAFTGSVEEWNDGGGKVARERTIEVEFPEWCEVTVWRLVGGQRCAFSIPVYWIETYARIGKTELPNEMWQKRARGQLHKCAMAASLRAAFPEASSGPTAEEMEGKVLEASGEIEVKATWSDAAQPPAEPEPPTEPPAEAKEDQKPQAAPPAQQQPKDAPPPARQKLDDIANGAAQRRSVRDFVATVERRLQEAVCTDDILSLLGEHTSTLTWLEAQKPDIYRDLAEKVAQRQKEVA